MTKPKDPNPETTGDLTLDHLKRTKQPLTRENYLNAIFPDQTEDQPLDAEQCAMVPDFPWEDPH